MDAKEMVFPGSTYGIPMLDITMQADAVTVPFCVWGRSSRTTNPGGTYCFYTNDYKFSALWKHPWSLCNSGSVASVEVNFSTNPLQPEAVVIYNTFRKRWLSRYWQSNGVRMIVDLNVDERWQQINMIGVPPGWGCYSTRAHRGSNDQIVSAYSAALERCGTIPKLFIVYGGGQEIQKLSESNGWLWIPECMSAVKAGKE